MRGLRRVRIRLSVRACLPSCLKGFSAPALGRAPTVGLSDELRDPQVVSTAAYGGKGGGMCSPSNLRQSFKASTGLASARFKACSENASIP